MTTTAPTESSQPAEASQPPAADVRRPTLWKRWRIGQRLGVALVIAAVTSAILTYAVFSRSVPFLPATPSVLMVLLNVDLVLFVALALLLVRRVARLWAERRRGMAASGLHVRLVVLFSLVAGLPAVLVTTFSVLFLHYGLQGWFSQQIDKALANSLTVAGAYLQEHSRTAARDTLAVAAEMRRDLSGPSSDDAALTAFLERHIRWRGLEAAIVFAANGDVVARTGDLESMANEIVPDWAMADARAGEVAVVIGREGAQLRGLVRLSGEPERFLYVSRAVDQEVLRYISDIRASVNRFQRLQVERSEIELTFGAIFAMLALLLVMVSIWFGLSFAGRLARPIAALMEAAERVRAGDLEVRLTQMGNTGEFQMLGRTFNRMTAQLRAQRQELVEANRQLDQRRRFTEAVLSGVAAGVVGLDGEGRIRFPNSAASHLLDIDLEKHRDQPFIDLLPDFAPLIERAHRRAAATTESQIVHRTAEGERTFLVRVTVEAGGESDSVVTFTDITDLLDAQRKAAWSDIARRIAHEIKNPLTPIQLSAERLRRRYLPQVTDDPQTFELCTDTIIRQVDGLRRLVDEFSDFARLPSPRFVKADLLAIARESISLQQSAAPTVNFHLETDQDRLQVLCDGGQIARVFTNLLQNAVEAIERCGETKAEGETAQPVNGDVTVSIGLEEGPGGPVAVIAIADTGAGLPEHLRDRLADPYVTTRAKGTGLGLAIVQKIVTDHGGGLQFQNRPGGGALVTVTIAVTPVPQGQTYGA